MKRVVNPITYFGMNQKIRFYFSFYLVQTTIFTFAFPVVLSKEANRKKIFMWRKGTTKLYRERVYVKKRDIA